MPKIYDQKQNPEREPVERSTLGQPGGPLKTEKRGVVLAIVVILAVLILLMVYRMARGEETVDTAALIIPATLCWMYHV
jgi:hypothetical protein